MVCPPDTTSSTPRLARIFALPSPAATATKPKGLRSAVFSAANASLRAALCSCMLWMCTSETCASWSRNQPSTLSERFECTCTLKLGCMPTSRSQSPMVVRKSLAASTSSVSECTRNSVQ